MPWPPPLYRSQARPATCSPAVPPLAVLPVADAVLPSPGGAPPLAASIRLSALGALLPGGQSRCPTALDLDAPQIEEVPASSGGQKLKAHSAHRFLQVLSSFPPPGRLGDEEQPVRLEGTVRLCEVVAPVSTHERQTEDRSP